ncbi:DUF1707 domain-containing protein [Kribbella sp. NPDC051620]|uniref:DUF1707 domain-containing protein n=1 Tax=Kribbella sp. NPDC051620 TaxID=3364120 RepID=UPI003789D965
MDGPLTLDQVASDALVPEDTAGRLLAALIGDSLVGRLQRFGERTQYELTRAGRSKARELVAAARPAGNDRYLRMMRVRENTVPGPPPPMRRAAGRVRRVRQPAAKLREPRLRLTDQDRSDCSSALAEEHAHGRLTMDEFNERTSLLYAASTRADLGQVFEGLQLPVLGRTPGISEPPPPEPEPIPAWRRTVSGILVAMSVPFFLIGLLLLDGPFEVDDTVVGVIFMGGAVLWSYLALSWSRRK